MNSKNIQKLGKNAEDRACELLRKKGFEILFRNFHSAYGEIDIIARDSSNIVFVEVKFRKKNSMVSAEESVNKAKQKKIIKTALIFLQKYESELVPRFDVIAINSNKTEHIENAFEMDGYENSF